MPEKNPLGEMSLQGKTPAVPWRPQGTSCALPQSSVTMAQQSNAGQGQKKCFIIIVKSGPRWPAGATTTAPISE